MKKLITAIFVLISFIGSAFAQKKPEVYIQTDLTSAYLWRGEKIAGVSIQPSVGLKWRGLHFYVWANEQLSPPSDEPLTHEIDLVLKYSVTSALEVGLRNVYLNTRGAGFFSYGSIPHAANGLDMFIAYDFRYVKLEWNTSIAGYDGYNHSGKRAYGSYFTVSAPFSFARLDWEGRLGIVPYYCSRYTDDVSGGFHVNMCALEASHTFAFPKSAIDLTPYTQFMLNPSARTAYFEVGARFRFTPASLPRS
ncbi:MAG: hypothetical protein K2I39_03655 [Muribaculaceae bacterium]|nr:hypothetical protein [Muribaculaceae bacterium]